MRDLTVLLVLLAYSAGCVASNQEPAPDDSGTVKRAREHAAPPPIEWENQTLLNVTLRYPRLQQGTQHRVDFNVSLAARDLYVRWQSLLECPVGRSSDMKFSLTSPEGSTNEYWLAHGSASGTGSTFTWDCRQTPTAAYVASPIKEAKPGPTPGPWILRTLGDCMCSSRFSITSELPAPTN
ncbi:MAG: hypothetical protein HYT80_03555 [Euryarchaeota archaeon]|nr:hypothetical protein [Euryarchaeota archaeon]